MQRISSKCESDLAASLCLDSCRYEVANLFALLRKSCRETLLVSFVVKLLEDLVEFVRDHVFELLEVVFLKVIGREFY